MHRNGRTKRKNTMNMQSVQILNKVNFSNVNKCTSSARQKKTALSATKVDAATNIGKVKGTCNYVSANVLRR